MNLKYNYFTFKKITLYQFLKKHHYGDKYINALILQRKIVVNDIVVTTKHFSLYLFNKIKVTLLDEVNTLPLSNKNLEIIYEDEYFLVVNKEANLDVEPTKNNYEDSLASRVAYYYKTHNIASKIHLVNRLDKMTSGLIILAKNQYFHALMQHVKIKKYYQALVVGKTKKKGLIKINIVDDKILKKRVVSKDGKLAKTKYQRLSFDGENSLLKIKLLTGRTHQIRVSLAYINHPLVNDLKYGNTFNQVYLEPLKAYYLRFYHPFKEKYLTLTIKI